MTRSSCSKDYSKDVNAIPQLKTFADETLPTLVAHKAEAERVRDVVDQGRASDEPKLDRPGPAALNDAAAFP